MNTSGRTSSRAAGHDGCVTSWPGATGSVRRSTSDNPAVLVRELRPDDMPHVRRIDAMHTGENRNAYWDRIAEVFFERPDDGRFRIALAAEAPADPAGGLLGFLLGEVRAFEFGSEPCGWVFAVGVDPGQARHGIASALLDETCARFAGVGVQRVRTMVLRDDVPVLSFFRSNGFVGGAFAQLEIDLAGRQAAVPPPEALA